MSDLKFFAIWFNALYVTMMLAAHFHMTLWANIVIWTALIFIALRSIVLTALAYAGAGEVGDKPDE